MERGCMNWGRKMAGKRLESNKTTCSTRGHTPQDHKPPPKVEEGFLCAHPALTHTPIHTRSQTQQRQSILPRKVHGKVEVAVAVEVDARGTERNATEEEEGRSPARYCLYI
eukprot:scaffold34558_cov52-Phaeocystis_antarctica.AAC.1